MVVDVLPARRGRQLYKVSFPSGISDVLEADLKADFNESDPFERCKSGIFGSYSDYAQKNTTFKIRNSNNSTLSSLKASKTLFRVYQFKPLLKFLNSPNRRLLVADEVGLGKTIEAGHIMLELKARRELSNVLIVCPKSLQEKWKNELYEKFGLLFKIYDSSRDLIADVNERIGTVRAIVNYEKIRMRKANKDKKQASGGKASNLVDYLIQTPRQFSMVICDEAHKMRNRETQTYRGAEIVMSNANAALFLTATPVMISTENLYNLLHLLDNTRHFNYQIFDNRLQENRPFIEAISSLNNHVPLQKILYNLVTSVVSRSFSVVDDSKHDREIFFSESSIKDLFQKDPVFKEIIDLLKGEDTPKVRARLQYLLSSMSVMNLVFSRTRKREVTTDMSQAERRPHLCKIVLHQDEKEEYDKVVQEYEEAMDEAAYYEEYEEEGESRPGPLGFVQRKRQIASSVWGYLNKERDLDRGIDAYEMYPDAKVEKLLSIIDEVFSNGTKKLVVFAIYRRTLKYLQIRLKKHGINALIIHGQLDNRADIINRFKHDENINILLSSEVGSEGLDMQFCNSMVNYDLPWNPMVVEQRIGRIDRFGQKSPVVNIYNMVVAGSIQEEIYMRLLDRIGIFRGTIGDMEAILDAPMVVEGKQMTIQDVYNKMEKETYTKNLSKEELDKKIAEVERAIANEKENLQHLQEGLSSALTNDAYFKDEINRILYNNAYVTDVELRNYLQSIVREYLTTCKLTPVEENVMEFHIPISRPEALRKFLTQYASQSTDDGRIALAQFRRRVDEEESFRLTFSQDKAYDDTSLNYLNIYHPMIQACLNYFVSNEDPNDTSFSYALQADEMLKEGERFYMGLYQLTTHRMVQGQEKESAELMPVVFDIENKQLVNDEEIVNRLYRRSQVEGSEHNASNEDLSAETIDDMRYDFADYVRDEIQRRQEEVNRQMESDKMRNIQQTEEYYKSRIDSYKSNISQWELNMEWSMNDNKEYQRWTNAIRLARANIQRMEKERDERLALINEDNQLTMEDKILSINLITII